MSDLTLDYEKPSLFSRASIARFLPLLAPIIVFIIPALVGGIVFREMNFLSVRNFSALLENNAYIAIAAIGATFVILSGGIDLSVGAIMALSGVIISATVAHEMHPLLGWGFSLAAGTIIGVAMGALIHFYDIPPFMVTLAGMFFTRATCFLILEQSQGISHPFYDETLYNLALPLGGRNKLALIAWFALVCYAVAVVVAHFTSFGRNVYAVGGDETSAKLMGVPVGRTKIGVYALAGFCSALAGIAISIFKGSGDPKAFIGVELDAIAAVVIGGTLLTGGVGFVVGTLFGVLILGIIQTMMDFKGDIKPGWNKVVIGALLLVFVVLQRFLNRERKTH